MTSTHTIIIQTVLALIQLGNALTSVVPDKWKTVVLGVVALAQIVQARLAHNSNPDGTPASMAYVAKLLLLCLLLGSAAMAQTPAPTPIFSVSTQAIAVRIGGQTVPGTDAIGSFNLTKDVQLQSDNILAPGNGLQAYLGGVKYYAPFLSKPFAKTTLSSVTPYVHGAFGIVRNVPSTGATQQHYSALAGAGFDYKVNGMLSFGPSIEYLNAPGFGGSPHGVKVSANLTLVLGSK